MSATQFFYRYLSLVLLAWIFPPVAGAGFVMLVDIFSYREMAAILRTPEMIFFILFGPLCAGIYFSLYASPIRQWLGSPSPALIQRAMARVRYFPLHFWGLFLLTLLWGPNLAIWLAEHRFAIEVGSRMVLPVHLVAMTVSILAGVPLFFLLGDLFARALPGVERISRGVTSLTLAQAALEKENRRALAALQAIDDGVITTSTDGRIDYLNPVAERLLGQCRSEVVGLHYTDVLRPSSESDGEVIHDLIDMILHHDSATVYADDRILRHVDGRAFSIDVSAASMHGEDGRNTGVVLVLRDNTEVVNMARQLGYQSSHDMLTGLYNRREFEKRLEVAIKDARSADTHHVLLYLDLDQFKLVNETYGHRAGDELLRQLAGQLSLLMGDHDVLARLGGDEFGILLRDCPLEKATAIAETIRGQVRDFRFTWEDRVFEIGVSIGVVPISAHSGALSDVMSYADAACYVAKDAGRNRVHLYRSDDKAIARHHREMAWIHRIHDAFEENRFMLYFQSITPLQDGPGQLERGEVLMRMLDDNGKPVTPMQFIPAAERYNLMPIIDRWVVRTTLGKLREAQGPRAAPPFRCTINLSGQSLNDEHFLDFVLSNMQESDVPGSCLCFEITETAAITNLGKARHFIDMLKKKGCTFALDDFGSGLSSFGYLKGLNVDYLKIDGAFIRGVINDTVDRLMVSSINQIGHAMGLQTIAEFVENEEIMTMLKELGLDYAQGFGIARPCPLDEVVLRLGAST